MPLQKHLVHIKLYVVDLNIDITSLVYGTISSQGPPLYNHSSMGAASQDCITEIIHGQTMI